MDFALTPPSPPPTMQPESSDGLASVGTILPEGTAAGNFGGRFPFYAIFALAGGGSGEGGFTRIPTPCKITNGFLSNSGRRSSVGRATDS